MTGEKASKDFGKAFGKAFGPWDRKNLLGRHGKQASLLL